LKVKALSEELENPLNAHRCRKLEGVDNLSKILIERSRCLWNEIKDIDLVKEANLQNRVGGWERSFNTVERKVGIGT
jgi:hypothetical protein